MHVGKKSQKREKSVMSVSLYGDNYRIQQKNVIK